jgi:hypothetical protein
MLSEGRKAAMSEVLVEESRWGQLEPDHVHFDRRTMTEVGDGLCAAGIMKTTGPKPGDAPRPHRLIKMQGEVVTGADWRRRRTRMSTSRASRSRRRLPRSRAARCLGDGYSCSGGRSSDDAAHSAGSGPLSS